MLDQYLDFRILLLLLPATAFLAYVWDRFFSLHGLPAKLPWAGADNGVLGRGKVNKSSFFGLRQLIQDGHEKVRTKSILDIR